MKDFIGITNNSDLLNYLVSPLLLSFGRRNIGTYIQIFKHIQWWDLVGGSGGINAVSVNGVQAVTEVLVGVAGVTPTIAAAPAVAGAGGL